MDVMPYCPKCGKHIEDVDTIYCPRCGTRLVDEPPPKKKKEGGSVSGPISEKWWKKNL